MESDPVVCLDVLGGILVLFALFTGWRAMKDWRRYRESENWIPVPGQVKASKVTVEDGYENTPTTYTPIIIYTYPVMGKTYQNHQISFGSEGISYERRKKAERVIARHPVGSQSVIHYNPDDPSQAVLERKFHPSNAITCLVVGLLGVALIYIQYHQG